MPRVESKNCYGCAACSLICPVNAIQMVENAEKFFVIQIDCLLYTSPSPRDTR